MPSFIKYFSIGAAISGLFLSAFYIMSCSCQLTGAAKMECAAERIVEESE